MDTSSTLEILPDEVLLEMCKYLLCSDILYSFMGLNYRMTRMIAQYRQHLSLHKASLSKFDYLCVNILPQIGSQIRSLVIDCCYSLLQDRLFTKYFSEKMSIIFPHLERISLISYTHDQLITFLNTLHDLNHLTEIRLYSLFPIQELQQPAFARALIQANNRRLRSIFCDSHSSSLSFDRTDRYLNILQLRLKLKTVSHLPFLFAAVPNVQHLDMTIDERDSSKAVDTSTLSPLIHLTDFRLKSVARAWTLEELMILFALFPSIQSLSLFLCTVDQQLIQGDLILPVLPSAVQQFNYAIYFFSNTPLDENNTIFVSSWPPSQPVACFFNDIYLFLHTLPWHFSRLEFPSSVGKMISCQTINGNGYDKHVEQICLTVDRIFTLGKCLTLLSQCRRMRELIISVKEDGDVVKEEKPPVSYISKLSHVRQLWFHGLIPADLKYFSIILNATPNLFRLDLSFGYLWKLIEDPQICSILNQRIISLCVFENQANSSAETLAEKHIPIIASALSRVRDIYINIMHLPCSTLEVSSAVQNDSFVQSNQTSESMLLCLLTTFKEHKLIAVCIDGQFLETIKTDPEQWLRANTILSEQQFIAAFHKEVNRLLIWM